tara:strand:+ start:922 stop:1419 length:498 start_codon:yes stop_codon:yes gene_type:complete
MDKLDYLQIVLSLITFFILLKVYHYLDKLKMCDCFIESQDENYKVNVNFLKFYQVLEMISLSLLIVLTFLYKNNLIKSTKNKKVNNIFLKTGLLVMFFLTIMLSGYITYNSLIFYLISKKNCECSNKWQKYFIYMQGVGNSVFFLRLVFILLFTFILIIFNSKKD